MGKSIVEKLFLCLLLLAGTVCMSSCNKDEEEGGSGSKSDLLGAWVMIHSEGYNVHQHEEWSTDYDISDNEGLITFYADGTCISYDEKASWTYRGDYLYVQQGKDETIAKVLSLTSSELIIEITALENDNSYYEKNTFVKIK